MKVELFSGKVLPELKKIKTDDTQFPDGGKAKDIFADIARALTPQNKSSSSAIAISHSSANQARLLIEETRLKRTNRVLPFISPTGRTFVLIPEEFFIDKSKVNFLQIDGLSRNDFEGIDRLFNPETNISTIRINLPHQKIEAYARKSNQSDSYSYLQPDYEGVAANAALERSLAVFAKADDGTDEGSNFAKWGIDQFKRLNEHHKQTVIHSYSVYELTLAFCEFLKFDKNLSQQIVYGALPHDIGKLHVDKELLEKKGQLTKDDWLQIKEHPSEGFKMAKENGIDPKTVDLPVILWHHKSSDKKSGYPEGPPKLTLGTEIVHVVDVYNALTGFREYRKSVDPRIAMKLILRGKGTDFNSKIADEFSRFLGFDPKELEREIEVNKHILRVLHNGSGTTFHPEIVSQLMSKNEYRPNDLKEAA